MQPYIERHSGPFLLREYPLVVAAALQERRRRCEFMRMVMGWEPGSNCPPSIMVQIKQHEAAEL